MAFYERWRTQHDADEYLRTMGFEEKVIHGVRLYYNVGSGECLDLFRSKQLYEKTLQHGIHISEGVLERLVATIQDKQFEKDPKQALREFVLREKNTLNNMKKEMDLKENL